LKNIIITIIIKYKNTQNTIHNTKHNTKMQHVYYKLLDSLKYKGFDLYYKKPIDTSMQKAVVFDDKYVYYYKCPHTNIQKSLGKYLGVGKRNTDIRSYDYDFEVYEFELDYIAFTSKSNIYCEGIPDLDNDGLYDNMILMEKTFYMDYPVYYKITI